MFDAISQWFKSVWYFLTGKIDASRRGIDIDPHVVRAKYDKIIKDKIGQIHVFKQAVASLITQQEAKMVKVKELTDDVQRLERLRAGALAKAKSIADGMRQAGKSNEAIHAEVSYVQCKNAYADFSSTLKEKQARIGELEGDIKQFATAISEHKERLQGLARDVEKIKGEAADAVADLISAQQEQEIAETIAGIGRDRTAQELQRLRELRQEVRAETRVSKEIAGTDKTTQEKEFLEFARQSEATNEFDVLIGIAEKVEAAAPQQAEMPVKEKRAALPE